MNLLKAIEEQCKDEPELIHEVSKGLRESVLRKIIEPERLLFEERIKEMESLAATASALLFSKEIEDLKQENMYAFVKQLIFISIDTIFFSSSEMVSRFTDLGIPNKVTRWMIPITPLTSELEKINASTSLLIRPHLWIYFIHIHLVMNLTEDLMSWAKITGKKRNSYYNDLHNRLYDLHRTKEYYQEAKKTFKGTNIEHLLIPVLNEAAELISAKEAKRDILQSSQGKTEKNALAIAFNDCSFHFANGQAPYIVVWDLIKLLVPNKNLMDLETFQLSEQYETYDRNYKRYQYYTLKKIIPILESK